jgi:hypothetical protein
MAFYNANWTISSIVISVLFFIQGDQKVCAPDNYNSHTIDDLKMAITEYIRNAILNLVFENTVQRVNKCLETGRGHFEHYL